jgi:nitric oxide reductase NorQ protein
MAEKAKNKATKTESKTDTIDWELIERVLGSEAAMRIYLYGLPGVGKTYAAYTNGLVERGLYACTLMPETPAAELRGTYLPMGDSIVWHDGPVVRAMREGARLVLNELSHASEDALAFLYPVLENSDTARITLPTGETVVPAPGFQVVVTDNAAPDDLPAALRDRFDAVLEIREPHPSALAQLSEPLREVVRRGMALDEERRVSVRPVLAIDRLAKEFGLRIACLIVLGAARGSLFHDALVLAGAK